MRELNSVVDYFSAGCKKIPKHEISLFFLIVYRLLGPGNQKEMSCCCFWGPVAEGIGHSAATRNHFEEKTVSLLAAFSFGDDFRNLRFSYGKPKYFFHLPWIFVCFFHLQSRNSTSKKVEFFVDRWLIRIFRIQPLKMGK